MNDSHKLEGVRTSGVLKSKGVILLNNEDILSSNKVKHLYIIGVSPAWVNLKGVIDISSFHIAV